LCRPTACTTRTLSASRSTLERSRDPRQSAPPASCVYVLAVSERVILPHSKHTQPHRPATCTQCCTAHKLPAAHMWAVYAVLHTPPAAHMWAVHAVLHSTHTPPAAHRWAVNDTLPADSGRFQQHAKTTLHTRCSCQTVSSLRGHAQSSCPLNKGASNTHTLPPLKPAGSNRCYTGVGWLSCAPPAPATHTHSPGGVCRVVSWTARKQHQRGAKHPAPACVHR
jgi:hypothetical protein